MFMNVPAVTQLHIEPTNMCTLKCSGCARTQFINQFPQHWSNHNLDIDLLLNFVDVNWINIQVLLCGDYGDPIYHPHFLEFVQKLKNTGTSITITTNGSYKSQRWWEQLCDTLDSNDSIVFSIDGDPSNFTNYRINGDWKSTEIGLQVAGKSLVKTKWKYIAFSYNLDSISIAQELLSKYNLDEFELMQSDRYDSDTQWLKPDDIKFVGDRHEQQQKFKQGNATTLLNPYCKTGNQHYISADGFYSPCCFVADHHFYYKTVFGKKKKQFDIRNSKLSQMIKLPDVVDFYKDLSSQTVCQFNCPDCPSS